MEQLSISIYYIIIALATGIIVSACIFIMSVYIIYKIKILDEELEEETIDEEVN